MAEAGDPICGKCGYDLTGLAPSGACPECGQFYDTNGRVGLKGDWADRHARQQRLMARTRTVLIALAVLPVMVCGGLLSMVASNPMRPAGVAGLLCVVLVVGAVVSFLYEKPE